MIHPEQAAVVRRIFDEAAAGRGLTRIAKGLNADGIPGPRGKWNATGVREILRREDYRGVVILGRIRRTGPKSRERVPEEQWQRRHDESLRVVTDEEWKTAHAEIAAHTEYISRRNMTAKVESTKGKFLLSGLVRCGVGTTAHGVIGCGGPLVALQRGRNLKHVYVCRNRRESGPSVCANTGAVPMAELHATVIRQLRQTFSPAKFEEHLRETAAKQTQREDRERRRTALLARIPQLDVEARRLAEAVALGNGSVDVLLAAIKERQTEREQAQAELADIQAEERDLRSEAELVEELRANWKTWEGALESDLALARSVLRKVLETPIVVASTGSGRGRRWVFAGDRTLRRLPRCAGVGRCRVERQRGERELVDRGRTFTDRAPPQVRRGVQRPRGPVARHAGRPG